MVKEGQVYQDVQGNRELTVKRVDASYAFCLSSKTGREAAVSLTRLFPANDKYPLISETPISRKAPPTLPASAPEVKMMSLADLRKLVAELTKAKGEWSIPVGEPIKQ